MLSRTRLFERIRLTPEGYSLKHYRDFFTNNEWQRSFKNSLIIAPIATIISVSLRRKSASSTSSMVQLIVRVAKAAMRGMEYRGDFI